MLQMSQIEKPRCSAKIDQMRLRWTIDLPVDFRNVSSSGSHSEIQLVSTLLLCVFRTGWDRQLPAKTTNVAPRRSKAFLPGRRRCLFSARQDARLQQRRRRRFRLYKLHANRARRNKILVNQSDKPLKPIPALRCETRDLPSGKQRA